MRPAGSGPLLAAGLLALALLAACLAGPRPGATGAPVESGGAPRRPAQAAEPRPAATAPPAAEMTEDPWLPVARALDASCRPCHFPGGKMYARLPFDDPATVRSHGAGIAGRLEGDDLAALERLLATPG